MEVSFAINLIVCILHANVCFLSVSLPARGKGVPVPLPIPAPFAALVSGWRLEAELGERKFVSAKSQTGFRNRVGVRDERNKFSNVLFRTPKLGRMNSDV